VKASSYSVPIATGATPLGAVSLFVKRLEQVVGLVDELLNPLARGIGRAPAHEHARDGKGQCSAETRDADPDQRAREVLLTAFFVGSIEFGVLVHGAGIVRSARRGSRRGVAEVRTLRQHYDYACCNVAGDPMITERDDLQERDDDRATLVWSLLVSGFLNLMGWMLVAWTIALRVHAVAAPQTMETFVVTSSSLNIAKRTQPVPQQPNQQNDTQRQAQRHPKPQQAAKKAVPKPQAQPTELARITPNGTPQPRSAPKKQAEGALAEELAQQQVAFEHEAQQLNAQRAPLSIATIDPNQEPSSQQPFQMDMSGIPGISRHGEGYITPGDRHNLQGYHCYDGGTYSYEYPNGQIEEGDIPWRFCYPANHDPFIGNHMLAMPLPLRGYRLPPGTQLQPQAKEAYDEYLSLTQQSPPQ